MISAEQWLPADGLTLEPNAMKAAKEQEKCLALTAGPGAGKTEMLAQRADFLFRTLKVIELLLFPYFPHLPPSNIFRPAS